MFGKNNGNIYIVDEIPVLSIKLEITIMSKVDIIILQLIR